MNEDLTTKDFSIDSTSFIICGIKTDIEYRVYYNPFTRVCISKTTEKLEGNFVIVTLEQYEKIDTSGRFYVTNSGKIKKKDLDFIPAIMLQLHNTGTYRTIKNNNIFIVDSKYAGKTETWAIKGTL